MLTNPAIKIACPQFGQASKQFRVFSQLPYIPRYQHVCSTTVEACRPKPGNRLTPTSLIATRNSIVPALLAYGYHRLRPGFDMTLHYPLSQTQHQERRGNTRTEKTKAILRPESNKLNDEVQAKWYTVNQRSTHSFSSMASMSVRYNDQDQKNRKSKNR